MTVIIDEIEKKPRDCSECDLCIRDEDGKHYCAVNADWVYPYGESINNDCPVKTLIRCKDCRFFSEDWRCLTWHQHTVEHGYCYRAERRPKDV